MNKFKRGDKVRCTLPEDDRRHFEGVMEILYAYPNENGWYQLPGVFSGRFGLEPLVFKDNELELADDETTEATDRPTITLENLRVGDLVTNNMVILKVLARVDGIVALSDGADHANFAIWYTLADLMEYGYRPIQPDDAKTDDLTYVTLEEIAKLKGVPVENLRIRDGE